MTADPIPSKTITISVLGIVLLRPSAKLNNNPSDSSPATANKIPKKNNILGNSIFDNDLWTGLLVWWASLSSSKDVIFILALLKISAKVATIAKESIIPTYGGKCVIVLKIGTKIIAERPKYNMLAPCLWKPTSVSSATASPISPWKAGKKEAIPTGIPKQKIDGSKT